MTWIYNGKPFLTAPEDQYGFIYLLTNKKTKQKYIGKKIFWSKRTKKVAGKKNRKHFVKESDWKNYFSSSEDLKEVFSKYGKESFRREILRLCKDSRSLTYSELEYQVKYNVLTDVRDDGKREYYNNNILGKFFASKQ